MDQQEIMTLFDQYGSLAVSYGLDVLGALLLLIGGWIVAAWCQRAVRRGLGKVRGLDGTVVSFLSTVVRYLVLILVLVAVLAQFGVETALCCWCCGRFALETTSMPRAWPAR